MGMKSWWGKPQRSEHTVEASVSPPRPLSCAPASPQVLSPPEFGQQRDPCHSWGVGPRGTAQPVLPLSLAEGHRTGGFFSLGSGF